MARVDNLNSDLNIDMNMEVFNYGPVVIIKWRNEPGWPVEYVSGNVGLNLGYSASEFLTGSLDYESIIHPLDLSTVEKEIHNSINRNLLHVNHAPYRLVTPKGEVIWVSKYTVIQKNSGGKISSFLGYIVDITDRLTKEKKLNEIKERYESLLSATKEGVWDWDLRTDEVFSQNDGRKCLGTRIMK